MNYAQMMRWNKKHRKGIKITSLNSGFTTGSGFWPSGAFLKEDYWPYKDKCNQNRIEPLSAEEYYKSVI